MNREVTGYYWIAGDELMTWDGRRLRIRRSHFVDSYLDGEPSFSCALLFRSTDPDQHFVAGYLLWTGGKLFRGVHLPASIPLELAELEARNQAEYWRAFDKREREEMAQRFPDAVTVPLYCAPEQYSAP